MLRFRQILRSQARPSRFYTGPQTITVPPTVRHVRFRRPWMRSFIGKCLLYGAAFHLWSSFVLIRFDDDTDDVETTEISEKKELPTSQRDQRIGKEEEDDDEEPIFIPLSWSRVQEGELYTASDPEYQAAVKILRDAEQTDRLKDELAEIILQNATEQIGPYIGSPLSLTGLWLLPQFPRRRPPGYTRSGFKLTNEGITWATVPMDPNVGDRLQTFMKPVHVALAIKDAYYVLLKRQLDRFRNPDGQPDAIELLNGRFILSGNERENPINSHGQPKLQPPIPEGPSENTIPPKDEEPETQLHPSSIISSLQRFPLPDLSHGSDLHLASIAFKLRLYEHQAQSPRTPHQGSFFMSGPVGVHGPNGFCRFEVRGEYDPSMPGWRFVDMKIRDLNYSSPRPRGDQR